MSERDVFERRLEAAVHEFVDRAPTQINAARLTDSLATDVPRVRRLVPRPVWRLPNLGFAWILIVLGLLAVMGIGLIASGALRDVRLPPVPPAPSQPLATPPAVIASPVAATPAPSVGASPGPPAAASPTPSLAPSRTPSTPIGIVLPVGWVAGEQARFQDALDAAGFGARILASQDSATEKADVEALIRQGIKVLILCPQDGAAAAPAADEARAAGMAVISFGRLILDTASVDYYTDFDNVGVGAAMAQYLVDKAGPTEGNNLYLYAGNAADNNSFLLLQGAWKKLQPKIADGTFVIRNSSAAVALQDSPTLTRSQEAAIIRDITTNWDGNAARTLAAGNLAAATADAKGTVFVLAPNDTTALAIGDAFAADKDVTKAHVTGQDADPAAVQAIIDGRQGMTVFKDPRARAADAVSAAGAFLAGATPPATTTFNNGALDVASTMSAIVSVTRDNVQAALIDTGNFRATDFTGSWPGKP